VHVVVCRQHKVAVVVSGKRGVSRVHVVVCRQHKVAVVVSGKRGAQWTEQEKKGCSEGIVERVRRRGMINRMAQHQKVHQAKKYNAESEVSRSTL
jgi:hypothetical protein